MILLSSQSVFAQNNNIIDSLINLSLTELLQVEVEVASKSLETVFDAPSSVTVYTRQELLNMGLTSVEQLLNFVPGFSATRELVFNAGYAVAARGITTPQASYNVLFMIDGQRLNNDVSGGALTRNFHIPLSNVKQVEVIRGPGSALYGTSAFSGVVNIVTHTGINDIFVSAGNLASREAYVNFSKQFDSGHFSGFTRYFEDNGDKIYQNILEPEAMTSDPINGNDIYLSSKYNGLSFIFRHSQRNRNEFAFLTESLEGIEKYFTEHQSIKLGYQLYKTEDFSLDIDFQYMQTRSKNIFITALVDNFPDNIDNSVFNHLLEGRNSKESEWLVNLEARYAFTDKHNLVAGLQFRKPRTEYAYNLYNYDVTGYTQAFAIPPQTNNFNYTGIPYNDTEFEPAMSRQILGAYVQDKYEFNDKWAMTLGLRYDRYSELGSTTNPRAALVYAPTEKTKFKWLYGQAFRAPSLRQSFTYIPELGNPDLKSETIKTMELAWLQQFDKAQTTLTYFYSRAKNRIDTTLITTESGELARQFNNLPGVQNTAGWEFELSSKLTQNWSLRNAYTYMAKIDEQPQRFPEQTFSMSLNYHYNKWNVNLSGFYHDTTQHPIAENKIKLLDDYWVWHSAMRYTLTPQLTIVGRIHNLLDETYYNSTKFAVITDGVLNRGRTYSLGIEWLF
jgi:outer membrane receptor protein involved in Fe transport